MSDPVADAELALLDEVAATPTPGCVDRDHDHADLGFEQFLAGAVGARPGLELAAGDGPLGEAFERAVEGMAARAGTNTQFGCLLLLVPLVRAASRDALSPDGVDAVTRETTVDDAASFFRAFEHADVAVGDPPADAADLDVRRGADAVPAVRDRGLTLREVLALGAPEDRNAAEWTGGFPRTFRAADRVEATDGSVLDGGAAAFLGQLGDETDTLVRTHHGEAVAGEVRERAATLRDAPREAVERFDEDLLARGVNPGTTADVTAAGLFVARRRAER